MALDGEVEIFRGHAAAIVDDANEAPAAQFDRDVDAAGARVERILDELLDARQAVRRPRGRNAIDKNRIKTADGMAGFTKEARQNSTRKLPRTG